MIDNTKIGYFSDLKEEALQNPEVLKSFNEAKEKTREKDLMIGLKKRIKLELKVNE